MEEALDELNEEFFWLSTQALELQKEDGKLDQVLLGEEHTLFCLLETDRMLSRLGQVSFVPGPQRMAPSLQSRAAI